ncbi:mycothiol synthase [Haloactinospora alba]|uniref:Mycothiol acetyltransferase n=1 Tax=Haloactinospora alba TaxID=405555 RepID=A0A543N6V7_9ACTN|nr:mycothiol synthase [Haloactinospora alba]TQN27544.1 mycothiol synthase [Haloactinospora alba]
MSYVHITTELNEEEAGAVSELASSAQRHDGVAPLSEQTLLRVRHPQPDTSRFHLLYEDATRSTLLGVAFAERVPGSPDSGELVVAPDQRRRGHGATLLRSLSADAPPEGARVWAHGRLDGAAALARSSGMQQVRGLLKMRMPLRGDSRQAAPELAEPVLSGAGARLTVRPFTVGADEEEWLRVNSAAFADHPEQGRLTLQDVREREAEPAFDAAGFFVAEDTDGRFAGFHWTKLHPDGAGLTDGETVGEVYAIGVAPEWQGTGLGRALLLTGLRHLRDRGLPWVLLYVEEENRPAVGLYESLGFTVWDADVMYAVR